MTYLEAIQNHGAAIVGRTIVHLTGAGNYIVGEVSRARRLGAGYAEIGITGRSGEIHIPLSWTVVFA